LLGLPSELVVVILLELDLRTLVHATHTCRALLYTPDYIWQCLCKRLAAPRLPAGWFPSWKHYALRYVLHDRVQKYHKLSSDACIYCNKKPDVYAEQLFHTEFGLCPRSWYYAILITEGVFISVQGQVVVKQRRERPRALPLYHLCCPQCSVNELVTPLYPLMRLKQCTLCDTWATTCFEQLEMVRNIGGDGLGTRFYGVWDPNRKATVGIWILPNEMPWLGRRGKKRTTSTIVVSQQRWSKTTWNGVDDVSSDEEDVQHVQLCKICAERMVKMKAAQWRRVTRVGDKWKLPFWRENEE